jgi:hypothetical protein
MIHVTCDSNFNTKVSLIIQIFSKKIQISNLTIFHGPQISFNINVLKISRNKTAASDIQPKVCPNINIRVEMEEKKEKKIKKGSHIYIFQ